MVSTATLDVSGLHCPVCMGDVLDAVIKTPGVTHVAVGTTRSGHSRVAVTASAGVGSELLSAALHGVGFGVNVESLAPDTHTRDGNSP